MKLLKLLLSVIVVFSTQSILPGMSGLDLLDKIKQKARTPPPVVMMITVHGDAENYKRAIELGADDILTKPVDFTALKEKIKSFEL